MKLVVFSDLHGNSYALDGFLEKINNLQYDYIIFCGDIFGYYYNQKEVIKKLSDIDRLFWVRGNHDGYFLNIYQGKIPAGNYIRKYGHSYAGLKDKYTIAEVRILESCKAEYVLEADGCRIGIFHGTPGDPLEGRLYPDTFIRNSEKYSQYDIVILGHTHCRMVREEGNTLVMNPGSLGQPRDGKGCSFAVMDTQLRNIKFHTVEFDSFLLYQQIDKFDPGLKKLKKVLERRSDIEKDFSYCDQRECIEWNIEGIAGNRG